jgi:hypothetical protein
MNSVIIIIIIIIKLAKPTKILLSGPVFLLPSRTQNFVGKLLHPDASASSEASVTLVNMALDTVSLVLIDKCLLFQVLTMSSLTPSYQFNI